MPTWKRFDVETFCAFATSKRFWVGKSSHVGNVSTSKRFHVGTSQNVSTSENVSTSGRQCFVPGAILIRCQICCDVAVGKTFPRRTMPFDVETFCECRKTSFHCRGDVETFSARKRFHVATWKRFQTFPRRKRFHVDQTFPRRRF